MPKKKCENAEEVKETKTDKETTAEAENTAEAEKVEETKGKKSKKDDEKVKKLEEELAAQKDKYMRLAAEYDNYRKRTAKEKENAYGDARADTIKPFLAVYDNLERGIAQYDESDVHRQGLELILRQFGEVLNKLGVTEIEAQGQPFNPARHNAVMHVEDEAAGENTVVEVFQKGFMLGDKVLRFAMVKVAN